MKSLRKMKDLKINWFSIIKWAITTVIMILIFSDGERFFKEVSLGKALYLLRNIPNSRIFIYMILGILAVSITSLYDFAWFKFNPMEIKKTEVFQTAFIANSVNNIAGFGGIGGAVVRHLFYKNDRINDKEIIKINILLLPSFFTGLSLLMWFNIFRVRALHNIAKSYPLVYTVMFIFSLYIFVYLFSEFIPIKYIKKKLEFIGFSSNIKIKFVMMAVSLIDWLAAVLLIWFLGNEVRNGLNFYEVLVFFTVAVSIGIISPIPAGIGVFDLIMIFGLNNLGFSGAEATGTVILFRIFYYIVPFIFSLILIILRMTLQNKNWISFRESSHIKFIKEKIRLNESQIEIIKDIFAVIFDILILLASIIMIFSAITPTLPERIKILQVFFTITAMQFSQKTTLILGIMLLILSYEIRMKVKRAYTLSVTFLILGSLFTLIKGFNVEESFILLIITGIFVFTKDYFYRITVPFSWSKLIKQMFLSEFFIILYLFSGQKINYSFYNLHKGIELLNSTPNDYKKNAILITFIVQSFIIFWHLSNWYFSLKDLPWLSQTKEYIFNKLDKVLTIYPGGVLTHLIYSGDKYIYESEKYHLLIAFRPFQNNLIVLGDPIGETDNLFEFLGEFREFADLYGYIPVYYQVKEKFLSYYHDSGYTFFKLGEEAMIELENFSTVSKTFRGFRSTKNKLEKDGYKFSVLKEPHSNELINQIREVSKEWLGDKKEKGFSLGSFDKEYINRSPLAIITDTNGKITAFATIMPTYSDEIISVDLMRFLKNSPNGTMDFLFLMIFEWAKEQGYSYFYMGMAPLSNVGVSKFARREEKLAKLVYASRKTNYNFKGLRHYKDKFHPKWKGKYLAYPSYLRAESVLLNISVMISSFHKKIKK